MNNVFSVELPFFSGFYGSIYYNSDTIYNEWYNDEDYYKEQYGQDIDADDLDIHFDEYCNDVCDAFIEAFKFCAPDFVEDIEMEKLNKPKYYNFRTDRIYAKMTLSDDWKEFLLKFMEKNKDWLTKRIEKDWTSYDGFMSFMSNRYDEWVEEINKEEPDERYVITMIAYIMLKANKGIRYELEESVYENVYVGSYIYCTKEDKKAE